MSMETPLEQVTQKIIKARPDILELKFGCNISLYKAPWIIIGAWSEDGEYSATHKDDGGIQRVTKEMFKYNHFEILGRDITLEDVLMAIGKINDEWNRPLYYLSPTENYCGVYIKEKFGFRWTLGLPLHLQSEETIKFLNEIIK